MERLSILLAACLVIMTLVLLNNKAPRKAAQALVIKAHSDEDESKVREYYREQAESGPRPRLADYVMWRQRPYHGELLNIENSGIRHTVNPIVKGRPLVVWVFGGSTAWGFGNADDGTIPSLLSQELNRAGIAASVKNYGEWGYVNAQEVVALLAELTSGRESPDVVVFLDGLNDIQAPLITEDRGARSFTRAWFELFAHGDPFEPPTPRDKLRYVFGARGPSVVDRPHPPIPQREIDGIAGDIALRYSRSVKAVQGLAKTFHFHPLMYWQPIITKKRHLTEAERKLYMINQRLFENQEFCAAVARKVKAAEASDPDFRDIDEMFSETLEGVYTDRWHYTRWANARIAKKMSADVTRIRR